MIEDAGGSTTISFDPNCRPNLVRHKARYVDQMNAFAAAADIVRIRMSILNFSMAEATTVKGRGRLSRLVQPWSSLRVGSMEPRPGTEERVW